MKKLPNAVKWLIIVVVLALMGWMLGKGTTFWFIATDTK